MRFSVYYRLKAEVQYEIEGFLFTVEQKKEQKEVPGPRGSVLIQTQQLSQLLLLTTGGGGGACCWQGFWWSRNAKLPSRPCGTRPERSVLLLGFARANPPGLRSQAASTRTHRYMNTGSLQSRNLTRLCLHTVCKTSVLFDFNGPEGQKPFPQGRK